MELTELFKGLSDPIRLRIFHLLMQKGELCVCHLTATLGLPQSTVSRHLSTLKNCGLVESKREAKWVYYRLTQNSQNISSIADLVRLHAIADEQLLQDIKHLIDTPC